MRTEATPEGTPGRKHNAETWLAMATPDPAFFIVEVDDGETRREARPPHRREPGGESQRVPSRGD